MDPHLLRSHAILVEKATRALEKAVEQNDLGKVRKAMENGAMIEWARFPNKSGTYTNTLVQKTINHGNVEMLRYFLELGATTVTRNKDASLYERALNQNQNELDIIQLLMQHQVKISGSDQIKMIQKGVDFFNFLKDKNLISAQTTLGHPEKMPLLFWCTDAATLQSMIDLGCDLHQEISPLQRETALILDWIIRKFRSTMTGLEADNLISTWINNQGPVSVETIKNGVSFLPIETIARLIVACPNYCLTEKDLQSPKKQELPKTPAQHVLYYLKEREILNEVWALQNKMILEKQTQISPLSKKQMRL